MLAVEPELIEAYVRPGRVRLVFRPVLNHGERSVVTSTAAECAGDQDRFWAMHALLFERQSELYAGSEADLLSLMMMYAVELELDQSAFDTCMTDGQARERVLAFDAEQRSRGITLQPTFEINEQRLVGFQSFEVFQNVIESLQL